MLRDAVGGSVLCSIWCVGADQLIGTAVPSFQLQKSMPPNARRHVHTHGFEAIPSFATPISSLDGAFTLSLVCDATTTARPPSVPHRPILSLANVCMCSHAGTARGIRERHHEPAEWGDVKLCRAGSCLHGTRRLVVQDRGRARRRQLGGGSEGAVWARRDI